MAFIPYSPYIDASDEACSWIMDSVVDIQTGDEKNGKGKVQLLSGDWIDYEYLVIATGCTAELPWRVGWKSEDEGISALQDQQRRFKNAEDIVVIGGGAAGVELARDVKSHFPAKNTDVDSFA